MAQTLDRVTLEKARTTPAEVFASPSEVYEHPELSAQDKKEILERWAYDEREMEVATEEGMQCPNTGKLDQIYHCLQSLGVEDEPRGDSKQG